MKVRATAVGFHAGIKRPGDVFEVADGLKGSWFEPVAEQSAPKAEKSAKGGDKHAGKQPKDDASNLV